MEVFAFLLLFFSAHFFSIRRFDLPVCSFLRFLASFCFLRARYFAFASILSALCFALKK